MLSSSLGNYLQATVTRAIFVMNVYVSNIVYCLFHSIHIRKKSIIPGLSHFSIYNLIFFYFERILFRSSIVNN